MFFYIICTCIDIYMYENKYVWTHTHIYMIIYVCVCDKIFFIFSETTCKFSKVGDLSHKTNFLVCLHFISFSVNH